MACAVSAITGIDLVSGAILSRRVASHPSSTGRLISIKIDRWRFRLGHGETLRAVNSYDDFIPPALKATREHVAIHFVVFD